MTDHNKAGQSMPCASPEHLKNTFERVVCINLKRRPDRWKTFVQSLPTDWPFKSAARYEAVDGRVCPEASWWKQGPGAWGCYRTHLRIMEECLNAGTESVLILEDDVICCDGFGAKIACFLSHIPDNWDMIYLGGQHLFARECPPLKINDHVYLPYNVNRLHAYAVQGDMIRIVYNHLNDTADWDKDHHIDHHLGRLHQLRKHRIFTPHEWLVGQAEGKSNVSGGRLTERFWHAYGRNRQRPFVAVLGLHCSGSSAVAMMLHHLGVHVGNELGGYEQHGGGEAVGLAALCEDVVPFPETQPLLPKSAILRLLGDWISDRWPEADDRNTLAGGKHPTLCVLGDHLVEIVGSHLKIIHVERPLDESVRALQQMAQTSNVPFLGITDQQAQDVQRWLWNGKREFLEKLEHLTIPYANLLADAEKQIADIVKYLEITPSAEQIEQAVRHIALARECV